MNEDLAEALRKLLDNPEGNYDAYALLRDAGLFNHQTNTFHYTFHGNPFGQSHAQQFRQPPQDPERAKAVAQAKKIKAVVDDLRGDANTRQIAAARLEAMKAKHGLTDRDFR